MKIGVQGILECHPLAAIGVVSVVYSYSIATMRLLQFTLAGTVYIVAMACVSRNVLTTRVSMHLQL